MNEVLALLKGLLFEMQNIHYALRDLVELKKKEAKDAEKKH